MEVIRELKRELSRFVNIVEDLKGEILVMSAENRKLREENEKLKREGVKDENIEGKIAKVVKEEMTKRAKETTGVKNLDDKIKQVVDEKLNSWKKKKMKKKGEISKKLWNNRKENGGWKGSVRLFK